MIPKEIFDRLTIKKSRDDEVNWRISEIETPPRPCEDCGKTVTNRTIDVYLNHFPKTHWKTDCRVCHKVRNPETGVFDMTQSEYQKYIRQKPKK